MFVGGPIESVSIAGRIYAIAADADVNMKLGGTENDVQQNGNNTGRVIKTAVSASLTGVAAAIDPDNDDQEFLQEIADGNEEVPVTVTYASGATYSGKMIITGELQFASQSATSPFDMMGSQKLVKQ